MGKPSSLASAKYISIIRDVSLSFGKTAFGAVSLDPQLTSSNGKVKKMNKLVR
jgi:hypothetical protein